MSRYCTVKTTFKDIDALVSALMETGLWIKEQIEVHTEPQHLYGYHGDQRQEVAHIIIRRKHVGRSSNDLGFIRVEDGSYEAIVSEFDSSKYNASWMSQLKGNYAYHTIARDQEKRGRTVSRERSSNGCQRITVTGYR